MRSPQPRYIFHLKQNNRSFSSTQLSDQPFFLIFGEFKKLIDFID